MSGACWPNEPYVHPVVYAAAIVSHLKEKFPQHEYLIQTDGKHPSDVEQERISTSARVLQRKHSRTEQCVVTLSQYAGVNTRFLRLSVQGDVLAAEDIEHILSRFSLEEAVYAFHSEDEHGVLWLPERRRF